MGLRSFLRQWCYQRPVIVAQSVERGPESDQPWLVEGVLVRARVDALAVGHWVCMLGQEGFHLGHRHYWLLYSEKHLLVYWWPWAPTVKAAVLPLADQSLMAQKMLMAAKGRTGEGPDVEKDVLTARSIQYC